MAERTHWLGQDSTEQDSRLGVAALFSSGTGLTAKPGVVTGLAVSQTGAASESVSVAVGAAVNQATSGVGGAYLEVLDAAKTVNVLGTNPAESSPRRDLIVYESGLAPGSKVHVVKGTAGAIPVDPAIPAQAVALARVRVKTAVQYGGTETIVNADIDDLRTYTGVPEPRMQRGWKFPRAGSPIDNVALGSYAPVAGGTITNAPAGDYLITTTGVFAADGSTIVNMQVMAGAANLSLNMRADRLSNAPIPTSFSATHQHGGGDLTLSLLLRFNSATGFIYNDGTVISAAYLGPR